MAPNKEEATIHVTGGRIPHEPRSTANARESNHYAVPPINKLPSEVLADIMRTVASSAPCWIKLSSTNDPVVRYPDVLTYVCSHWRQVAVQSRSLWSHIDLTTQKLPGSRAVTFLNRAGHSPLNIHIVDPSYTDGMADLTPFLTPIAPQFKSLELLIQSKDLGDSQTSILHTCLAICTAGNLTELDIRFTNHYYLTAPFFIGARGESNESTTQVFNGQMEWVYINVPQERFEDLLRGVNVLRLDHIYPKWTSSAYHGLAELRLLGGTMHRTSIAEFQLVNMLRHSPRLRILHFDLIITDVASLSTVIGDPVILQDLEVLNLDWAQDDGIEIFLRWLAPSPKLFQFSCFSYNYEGFKHPAVVGFLASSNITMIHAVQFSQTDIVDMVGLCHHIRVLALDDTSLSDTGENFPFKLHTLYLLWCSLEVNHLRQWIQSSSIQRLILYQSKLNRDGSKLDLNQVPALLSDICPEVVVVPSESPNPIEGWEVIWDVED